MQVSGPPVRNKHNEGPKSTTDLPKSRSRRGNNPPQSSDFRLSYERHQHLVKKDKKSFKVHLHPNVITQRVLNVRLNLK